MNRVHTHYDNLKVTRNAPVEVIKAAYRAMAQKYHPDVNRSPDAARVMKIVNEAWNILSDPVRRSEHDRWIAIEEKTVHASSTAERSFKTGSTEFVYRKPTPSPYSSNQGVHRSGNGHQSRQANSTQNSFNAHQPTASEGYKVSTPNWIRNIKNALNYFIQKFGLVKVLTYTILCMFVLFTILMYFNLNINAESKNGTSVATKPAKTNFDPNTAVKITDQDIKENSSNVKSGGSQVNPATVNRGNADARPDPWVVVGEAPYVPKRVNNGYLKEERQIFSGGLSTFKIDNSNGSNDAEVRLYLGSRQVRSMFVRVGTTFTAEKLAPGTYKMRYKMNINGVTKAFQAKEDFILMQTVSETKNGTRTQFSRMTVTLYKVRDGNMQTEEIPIDSF